MQSIILLVAYTPGATKKCQTDLIVRLYFKVNVKNV